MDGITIISVMFEDDGNSAADYSIHALNARGDNRYVQTVEGPNWIASVVFEMPFGYRITDTELIDLIEDMV